MKVVDNVKSKSYEQWIEKFVREVLASGKIDCAEAVIVDLDDDRIWLMLDGVEYHIRTWSFEPVHYDSENRPDAEIVRYSLFRMVEDHGEEVIYSSQRIDWVN